MRSLELLGRARVTARTAVKRAGSPRVLAERIGTKIPIIRNRALLTVVVPAYNVEDYLAPCLDSLTEQSFRSLEIVVVVDGATDRTLEIAKAYAAKDRRIRIHSQVNAGLSAARNRGASMAKGKYLWFVDSDDLVARGAAEKMVGSLRTTGSDFAVASYRRFDSSGPRRPGSWIGAAHEKKRLKTTARAFPQILANSVAWSKVYRKSFWDEHRLAFPVGALYEDQPVSARAYALATSIDVLPDQIYHWRERDDKSSISQQSHQLSDLDARLLSAETSLDELRRYGASDLVTERSVQLLANDLPHSMEHLADAEPEFWQHLADGIRTIAANVPDDRWLEIPSQHAALEWLLLHGDFERARAIVDLNDPEAFGMTCVRVHDHFALKVPFWDDADVAFPPSVIALAPRHMRPMLRLRRAHWSRPGTLAIEGWAYLPFVPMDELDVPATACLISDEPKQHVVPLAMTQVHNPDIDRVSKHQALDFRSAGFAAAIDIDALELHPEASYRIEVSLFAAGGTHTDAITVVHGWGSAANLPAETSAAGVTARLVRRAGRPVELRLDRATVIVDSVVTADSGLTVTMRSRSDIRELRASPQVGRRDRITQRRVVARVRRVGDELYEAVFTAAALATARARNWTVRAATSAGIAVSVAWRGASQAPLAIDHTGVSAGLAAVVTAAGNLGLHRFTPTAHIDALEQTDEGIRITGWTLGADAPDSVALGDHRHTAAHRLTVDAATGRFEAVVPWGFNRWGRTAPPPTGVYTLSLSTRGKAVATSLAPTASAVLPLWLDHRAPMAGRIERNPRTKDLVLAVDPTLTAEDRGARPQAQLVRMHRTGSFTIDNNAVLFRTYYGESATGNGLAIYDELRRTRPDLKLYWAVKDTSVRTPDGAIPIIVNSRQWYETLSTAKYLFDNVHQPKYFRKRPGQIFVETLHGYPFKTAGLPFWKAAGYGQRRIESFLERHQQWDYLISPAPYATPLLERDFPSPAATLEIGYPRNDIFFAPERHELRDRVRETLDLPKDVTAVLYAPTYRDNLSTDEFRSRMVDFLDLERACAGLGKKFVILVRGHMMNARVASRASGAQIIDVTDYPEITELCLASDAAILDYSSLRFDYALTGKPMVFLVPDLDDYRDDMRGWMLPYEETAPGPLVRDTDEVVDALRDLSALTDEYSKQRQAFLKQYMPLEDGQASARLVDAVFERE